MGSAAEGFTARCCRSFLDWNATDIKWSERMTHRMYSIEIRIDLKDERRHEAAEQIMRKYAKQIFAAFGLIRDHQKPQVTVYAHDHTVGHKDIALNDMDAASRASASSGEDDAGLALAKELAEALK